MISRCTAMSCAWRASACDCSTASRACAARRPARVASMWPVSAAIAGRRQLGSDRIVPDPAPTPPTERPATPTPSGGEQKPRMVPFSRRVTIFLVGLLVLNLVLSFITGGPPKREQVPYQPFFVAQLTAG